MCGSLLLVISLLIVTRSGLLVQAKSSWLEAFRFRIVFQVHAGATGRKLTCSSSFFFPPSPFTSMLVLLTRKQAHARIHRAEGAIDWAGVCFLDTWFYDFFLKGNGFMKIDWTKLATAYRKWKHIYIYIIILPQDLMRMQWCRQEWVPRREKGEATSCKERHKTHIIQDFIHFRPPRWK